MIIRAHRPGAKTIGQQQLVGGHVVRWVGGLDNPQIVVRRTFMSDGRVGPRPYHACGQRYGSLRSAVEAVVARRSADER